MKSWLKSLARRVFGGSSSVHRGFLAVPVVADWKVDDARQWKTFLQSPAGQTLWSRARARQASLCVEACDGKYDPKMAAGFSFTLNWLEQLANVESISSAELAKTANADAAPDEPQTVESELVYSH